MEASQSIKDILFSICSLFFKGLFCNSTRKIQFNINSPSRWGEDSRIDFRCWIKFVRRRGLLTFSAKCIFSLEGPGMSRPLVPVCDAGAHSVQPPTQLQRCWKLLLLGPTLTTKHLFCLGAWSSSCVGSLFSKPKGLATAISLFLLFFHSHT